MHGLCLPIGINESDMDKLEKIIKRKQPLKRGELLFHQGDPFHSLYAIRSGSVKMYSISDDGSEQITGFLLPGELAGMDAINTEEHQSCAKALETTSFCEIPFTQLEDLAGQLPSLRHQLLRLMSKEIMNDEQMLMQLGKKTAEERLASMLLSFSTRFKERGFSASEFNLSMSRNDIGDYLGLAVETVSRLFTKFQEQKLIEVKGKFVRLSDMEAMEKLAGISTNNKEINPKRA
jgi:CRP/FNR family transcriptional regulator